VQRLVYDYSSIGSVIRGEWEASLASGDPPAPPANGMTPRISVSTQEESERRMSAGGSGNADASGRRRGEGGIGPSVVGAETSLEGRQDGREIDESGMLGEEREGGREREGELRVKRLADD